MKKMSIPWLYSVREFRIPDDALIWIATPKNIPPAPEPEQEILTAILNPIESPGLKELLGNPASKKVAVVVDDNTRVTPVEQVLTVLVKELYRLGVDYSQITVIFALGSHRAMTEAEQRARIGGWCYERLNTLNHRYDDPNQLSDLGFTDQGTPVVVNRTFCESDLRICIGNIIPQFIAGWSGGAKIIQPGISGYHTTAKVHLDGSLTWPQRLGNAENSIRHDMENIAFKAGLQFMINTVLNLDEQIVKVVAGHIVKAHRAGVHYAEQIYRMQIEKQADIVIAGTYPANKDLWQADKGLAAAVLMVKPGGTVIWAAPCVEGVSPEHPVLLELADKDPEDVYAMCRNGEINDVVGATAHIMIGVMRKMARIILVSDGVSRNECETLGFMYAENIEQAVAIALEREGQNAEIGILTHGADFAPIVRRPEDHC